MKTEIHRMIALFTLKLEDLNKISFFKKKFSSITHWILKSSSRLNLYGGEVGNIVHFHNSRADKLP